MKRTESYRFGTPRQETGAKHVPAGALLEARNVRMVKAGTYGKRLGFARTAMSFNGGSLSGTPASTLRGKDRNLLMRDTGGQLWERSSDVAAWTYRGYARKGWATSNMVLNQHYTSPQPFSCVVGSTMWAFAITSGAYDLTIVSLESGVVTQQRVSVTAANIVSASAAYDGSNVWVFWVDNQANGRVYAHKFVVATPTVAPTATTYYTMPSTPVDISATKLQQVKCRVMPSASGGSVVFVCAAGGSNTTGTYRRAAMHSILDPATGLAVVAGGRAAAASVAYNGASGSYGLGGLCIHDGQDGSAGTWYYTLHGVVDTSYTTRKLVQVEVNSSTFSSVTLRVLASASPLPTPLDIVETASLSSGGYQVVISTYYSQNFGFRFSATQRGYSSNMYHVSGSTVTSKALVLDQSPEYFLWAATGFAQVGGQWYLLMGFDDFGVAQTDFGSEANTTQRTYYPVHVVVGASASASTIEIEAHHANGSAPALWHKNTAVITYDGVTLPVITTPNLYAYGTKAVAAVAYASPVTGYVDVGVFSLDTAKVYGQDCMMGNDRGITPGSIPVVWGNSDMAHEVAPLISPPFVTLVGGGSVATFNVFAAVYVITSPDGTVWRSAPKVLQASLNASTSLDVPVIPIKTAGASLDIEIYLGITSPKLQKVVPFSSVTANSAIRYTTPASASALIDGEVLYTWGGAVSQAPPVSCTAISYWKNRVLLGSNQNVYSSSERSQQIGPYFNEVQSTYWGDASGEITGIAPMDANYCCVFSQNGAGVLSGAGPDQRGNGNFSVQTIPQRIGLDPGGAPIGGNGSVFFQSAATGRIMAATPTLKIEDSGGGAWDYSSYAITSAAWNEVERMMVLAARDSSAVLVIDYQHPVEAAPFGQIYRWTTGTAQKFYGCDADDLGLFFVASDGALYRPAAQYVDDKSGGTDTYRMKLATAELQPSNINGEFSVSWIQALLSVYATTGAELSIYPGFASRTLADSRVTTKTIALTCTNAGDPTTFAHRPSNCARIQGVGLAIEESAGITNQSFEFEGFSIEYAASGRLRLPDSGKVI